MTTLFERFAASGGERHILDALAKTKLVAGDGELAAQLQAAGELRGYALGDELISEGGGDTDLFFVLAGHTEVLVKGVQVNTRHPGDHVGEIAAIDPTQTRSASVRALGDVVAFRVSEAALSELASKKPEIWRRLAVELAARLVQRNALVRPANDRPRVFIISSSEALAIAEQVQVGLEHADMLVRLWTDGVFRMSEYPLDSLEREVRDSDFAIVILHADDEVTSRKVTMMTPRDNVTFEMGMFTGALSRERTIIMEPSKGSGDLKLCSDIRGLNTLGYRQGKVDDLPSLLGPTCTAIKRYVAQVGVRR